MRRSDDAIKKKLKERQVVPAIDFAYNHPVDNFLAGISVKIPDQPEEQSEGLAKVLPFRKPADMPDEMQS